MKKIAISIKKLSKIYKLYDKPMDRLYDSLGLKKNRKPKEFYALEDISFDVYTGETVGIIGTNGSGKSTILKIITGVLNSSTGTAITNGRISALLELGAGFNSEYTGIENIYLNGTMLGYTHEEIDAKMQDIISFADIGDFINQPVKSYSSGMFVRLAFAVAINIDPEILIIDEALSVGDIFFQAKCYKKFDEFKSRGKTILFVTHDLGSVVTYCDRVILLNNGKKIDEGLPKDMVDLYKKILAKGLISNNEETNTTEGNNVYQDCMEKNPTYSEYGNGNAKIVDFYMRDEKNDITNCIVKGTMFTIGMSIQFNLSIQNPIVAFTIKNEKGVEITGTNTNMENKNITEIKQNDVISVKFQQEMSLQGGEYLLSLGCTGFENDGLVVYHRLYDICRISVISDKNSVGFFDMNSMVSITRK